MSSTTPRRGPGRPRRDRTGTGSQADVSDDDDQVGLDHRFDQLSAQLNAQFNAQMSQMMNQMMSQMTSAITAITTRLDTEHTQVNDGVSQMQTQMHHVHEQPVNAGNVVLVRDSAGPVSSDAGLVSPQPSQSALPARESTYGGISNVRSSQDKNNSREIKLFGRSVSTVPAPAPKLAGPTIEIDKYIKWSKDFKAHAVLQGVSEYVQWPSDRVLTELEESLGAQAQSVQVKRLVASRCKQVTVMIWNAVADVIPDLSTIVTNYYHSNPRPPDPTCQDDSKNGSGNSAQPPPLVNEVDVVVGEDPYLTMCYLDIKYNNDSVINVNNILTKYLNFRCEEGWSSTKFMSEFVALDQRLKSFADKHSIPKGEFLPPIVKSLVLLNSLPKSMQIEKRLLLNEKELTPDKIHQQFINWEELNKRNHKHVSDKSMLMLENMSLDELMEDGHIDHMSDEMILAFVRKHRPKFQRPPVPRNYQRLYDKHTKSHKSHSVRDNDSTGDTEKQDMVWYLMEADQHGSMKHHDDACYSCTHELDTDACVDDSDDQIESGDRTYAASYDNVEMNRCILDSGTTRHVWVNPQAVKDVIKLPTPIRMMSASGHPINVDKIGTVRLNSTTSISDVAICKSSPANLISAHRIVKAGFRIVMDDECADIVDKKTGDVVYSFEKENGLYVSKIRTGYRESTKDGFITNKPAKKTGSDSDTGKQSKESSTGIGQRSSASIGHKKIPRKAITRSSVSAKPAAPAKLLLELECDDGDTVISSDGSCYLVMSDRRHRY